MIDETNEEIAQRALQVGGSTIVTETGMSYTALIIMVDGHRLLIDEMLVGMARDPMQFVTMEVANFRNRIAEAAAAA